MSTPRLAAFQPRADPSAERARSGAAPVMEVFASIQGEGRYVGEPQVLLRLYGCPLRCRWCDTPGSWTIGAHARIDPGPRRAVRRAAPWVTPFQAALWIREVEGAHPRTVSATGGEPLVYVEFLRELEPLLDRRRLHLETGGGFPRALERVLERVDHVSLDLKLPADLDAPVELASRTALDEAPPCDEASWREARRAALALLAGRDARAERVVAGARPRGAFAPLLDDVSELAPDLPVYVQPVTPMHGVPAPSRAEIEAVVDEVLARGLTARVVPQVHRLLRLP
jgi:organic radical activating enzyme